MSYTNRTMWEEAEEARLEKLADLSGEYEMNSNADYIREAYGATIDSHQYEGTEWAGMDAEEVAEVKKKADQIYNIGWVAGVPEDILDQVYPDFI